MNVLNQSCGGKGLSCYTQDIAYASLPLVGLSAVGLGVAALALRWLSNVNWQKDIREHCQSLQNRASSVTAMILTTSTIALSVGLAVAGTAMASTLIGGTLVVSATFIAVNHLLHNHMVNQYKNSSWK